MKHYLPLLCAAACLFGFAAKSQVTKLSTNNNIQFGYPLGSVAVMFDDNGVLWKTDGTTGGTTNYTSKVVLGTSGSFAILNNKIYFDGLTAANGSELWVTDGTDAGTQLVKDIESGSGSSSPSDIVVLNNKLYFFASTSTSGNEMWVSDGTNGGTALLKDINPGAAGSYNASEVFLNGSTLFFTANDGTHGTELWKTDGTEAGTVLVKDINSGSASSNTGNISALNGVIYFSADDGATGDELWKSDGSSAGTVQVKDIVSGKKGSAPSQFFQFKNKLVFLVEKSGIIPTYQIWSTDGSGAGTTIIYDYSASFAFPTLFFSVVIGNKFYYSLTSLTGTEVWGSDGTTAGTALLKNTNASGDDKATLFPDIYGAAFSGSDFHTKLFNGKIFMTADDGTNGSELWITDGSTAGTVMVKDINSGIGSSIDLSSLGFYTQASMYFPADDGSHGMELWKSDGTGGGTALVKDINPGLGNSFGNFVMFFNGHVYFAADENGDGNNELFKIDATDVLPLSLVEFTATLNGKAARLNWTTNDEINTKDFTVQRSYDALHFDNIGSVKASGNTARKTSYQFNDAAALQAGVSKVYYRLQMNDNDGKYTFSKTVALSIIPQDKLVVAYPNPVKDYLNLNFNIAASTINVKIIDQNGKPVYQQQLNNVQPGTTHKITTSALKAGIYYVQWNSGNDVQSVKIVKY
ncbi:MAG TPA: T9SS type A sorting domain-containing protein [Panacibacter sp.]|nr:T9SS type A sorting domain-containing protein [Panacibacter sp.]HNP44526.1 T9SS type A sorting domain-containing protein [Panacibacter sp.]